MFRFAHSVKRPVDECQTSVMCASEHKSRRFSARLGAVNDCAAMPEHRQNLGLAPRQNLFQE